MLRQAGDQNIAEQAATEFDLTNNGGGKGAKKASGYAMPTGPEAAAGQAHPDDPQAAVIAGLLLGSPEFQRR